MKRLVIATHNKAKLDYFFNIFSRGLEDFDDYKLLSLNDFNNIEEPIENGKDELENAIIKARYYSKMTGEVVISDDAGMYIEALGGAPGVQVRRWGGKFPDSISDKEWLDYFVAEMKKIPKENREGEFRISRAIVAPSGDVFTLNWLRRFFIREKPDWKNYKKGWPMSTMYIEKEFDKPWTELDWDIKVKSERKNLDRIGDILKNVFK